MGKEQGYFKALVELITSRGSKAAFAKLFKKHFDINPTQEQIQNYVEQLDQAIILAGEEGSDDDSSLESSYDELRSEY